MKHLSLTRACALVMFFLFTAARLVFPQQGGKYVALVTELRGGVSVKPAHGVDFRKAAWGTQLGAGDVVKTSQDGSASILFSNNSLIEIGPGSSITIAAGPSTSGTKSRSIGGLASENVIDLSSLTMRTTKDGDMIALAGLRAGTNDQPIDQLSPRKSSIRTHTPVFEWQSSIQVDKFRVRLFGKNGLLWKQETDKKRLEYPAGQKPLQPGEEYFWQVEGLGLVESYQSPSIGFSVLSSEAAHSVGQQERMLRETFSDNPSSPSLDFLTGTLYQQRGLLDESIARFEAIARQYPDAPAAFEVLGKLYSDIGLKDKAITALQKALKLTQQQ